MHAHFVLAGLLLALPLSAGLLRCQPQRPPAALRCLQVSGCVKYNGMEASQFVLRRTAAFVDQIDYHIPNLTVRAELLWAAR